MMNASVVICTFNRYKLLQDSIISILAQNYPVNEYEIIVVDNNSTDETKDVVATLISKYGSRLKYVFEGRQGLSYARNAGILHAAGDIVVFTDDDIEAENGWLHEIVISFDNPDVACVGGPIRPIWLAPKPDWLTEHWQVYLTIYEFDYAQTSLELKGPCYPAGVNVAFRKSIFSDVGMFPTDLGRKGGCLLSNEESKICSEIEARGRILRFAPRAIMHHKITAERLKKQFFYHRLYWQGRSDAIIDLQSHRDISAHITSLVRQLLQCANTSTVTVFHRKCVERLLKGYIIQLIISLGPTQLPPTSTRYLFRLFHSFLFNHSHPEETGHSESKLGSLMINMVRSKHLAKGFFLSLKKQLLCRSTLCHEESKETDNLLGLGQLQRPLAELPKEQISAIFDDDAEFRLLALEPVDGNVSLIELAAITRLVKLMAPKKIFEIGTFDGRTALNMIANSPSDCQLYTLDLPAEQFNSTKLPVEPEDVKYIKKTVSGSRIIGSAYEGRITQLFGDSARFDYSQYWGQIDVVFIDGSHSYEYLINDTKAALRLLNSDYGLLIYHDYDTPWWPGVTQGLNELFREGGPFGKLVNIEGTSLAYVHIGLVKS